MNTLFSKLKCKQYFDSIYMIACHMLLQHDLISCVCKNSTCALDISFVVPTCWFSSTRGKRMMSRNRKRCVHSTKYKKYRYDCLFLNTKTFNAQEKRAVNFTKPNISIPMFS